MSELPEGWEERISSSRGIKYYVNRQTGQSQWDHPSGVNPLKIHVYHLLIKHANSRRPSSWREASITRSPTEATSLAQTYESQIRCSSEMLERLKELAGKYSDCGSAKRDGDLGWFGRGEMQKSFEDAAFALSPGQLSTPVSTDSGIHLIYRVA